jgi:lipoprotein-anchoring transpeptidase ErfK/SrfK
MIRPIGALLLTLPLAAGLAAASAAAQTREPLQLAQVGANSEAENDARTTPQAVPPPFVPLFGHQLDAQQSDPNAIRPPGSVGPAPNAAQPPADQSVMTLPPEDQPETGQPKELPPNLKRQVVDFQTREPAGTIIIDTPHTYLFLILGHGKAVRYGIGVGREGFTWSGTERISRMKEWPDWFPPAEMIERQPYLPRMMAGGPGNPLGARALYLGHTLYRIHGTNQPSTIGQFVSSGCIRLLNEDIEDLYSRVQVGTHVVVLPGELPQQAAGSGGVVPAAAAAPAPAYAPAAAPAMHRSRDEARARDDGSAPHSGMTLFGGPLPPAR